MGQAVLQGELVFLSENPICKNVRGLCDVSNTKDQNAMALGDEAVGSINAERYSISELLSAPAVKK